MKRFKLLKSVTPLTMGFLLCLMSVTLVPVAHASDTEEVGPCTIGFWKNRISDKKGLLKYYPNGELETLIMDAVDNSNGVFPDADYLIDALTSKGKRSTVERAKQQYAALLLNLAAGDEGFETVGPEKCHLKPCDTFRFGPCL